MRKTLIAASLVLFCCSAAFAGEPAKLDMTKTADKNGYSIGYQIGSDLKNSEVAINPDALAAGAKAALEGEKPEMDMDQMRVALTDLQKQMNEKKRAMWEEMSKKNKETGEKFLAENAKKDGVKTLPSGLQYSVIKEGDGPKPTAESTVTVQYKGSLTDGTEFDSSYQRGTPATFQVNRVIPGWTEALQLMPVGSHWTLFIPASLAYGDRGAPPKIGPNEALIFDVELQSMK